MKAKTKAPRQLFALQQPDGSFLPARYETRQAALEAQTSMGKSLTAVWLRRDGMVLPVKN